MFGRLAASRLLSCRWTTSGVFSRSSVHPRHHRCCFSGATPPPQHSAAKADTGGLSGVGNPQAAQVDVNGVGGPQPPQRSLRGMIAQYGLLAFVFHESIWATSWALLYLAVKVCGLPDALPAAALRPLTPRILCANADGRGHPILAGCYSTVGAWFILAITNRPHSGCCRHLVCARLVHQSDKARVHGHVHALCRTSMGPQKAALSVHLRAEESTILQRIHHSGDSGKSAPREVSAAIEESPPRATQGGLLEDCWWMVNHWVNSSRWWTGRPLEFRLEIGMEIGARVVRRVCAGVDCGGMCGGCRRDTSAQWGKCRNSFRSALRSGAVLCEQQQRRSRGTGHGMAWLPKLYCSTREEKSWRRGYSIDLLYRLVARHESLVEGNLRL